MILKRKKTIRFRYCDGRTEEIAVPKAADFSAYKTYPDGAIMLDEDEKLVTVAFYEVQRTVAERAAAIYAESGSLFQAGISFGEGPGWAESILRRYGMLTEAAPAS